MYESPDQRVGFEEPAGATAHREVRVEAHVGTPDDFADRLQRAVIRAARRPGEARNRFFGKAFEWAVDTRNLKLAWDYLKAGDGHAPGVDGMTYDDVPKEQLWGHLRHLHGQLADGSYEPSPLRDVEYDKGGGRGTRLLQLPTIGDRVVGRAVLQVVDFFFDRDFDESSFGFRPGRSRCHALARAQRVATQQNRWAWRAEDIADAFPSVPRSRLLDIVRSRLTNEKLIELIEQLMDNGKPRGIPQGQPICPLLLNIHLDRLLDRPWRRRNPDTPMIRVADDILVPCRNRHEAESAREDLEDTLQPAGMRLKGDSGTTIVDLRGGGTAEWLGLRLSHREGGLKVGLADRAWERLEESLQRAHTRKHPPLRAEAIARGWMRQAGVASGTMDGLEVIARVRRLARRQGFEELPGDGELLGEWGAGAASWERAIEGERLMEEGQDVGASAGRSAAGIASVSTDPCRGGPAPGSPPPDGIPEITICTDGSRLADCGIGGWAFLVEPGQFRQSGAVANTTGNRMELTAVIQGLESLGSSPVGVRLVTDSTYVAKGVTEWLPRWRRRGWRTGKRGDRPVQNLDLWQRLAALLDFHEVTVAWVRGHSGHAGNELCDRLARQAAEIWRQAVEATLPPRPPPLSNRPTS